MSGDLEKCLRRAHLTIPIPSIASLCSEAADAIEERDAEIDRLHTIGDALANALRNGRMGTAVVLVNQWWKARE